MGVVELVTSDELAARINGHLLGDRDREQAGFLFARPVASHLGLELAAQEWWPILGESYVTHATASLELADDVVPRVIGKARELKACVVEFHSHPFPMPACFSQMDLAGLAELVPRLQWRLDGAPFCAIVVGPDSFDALLWGERRRVPQQLDAWRIGNNRNEPTNLSVGRWHEGSYHEAI